MNLTTLPPTAQIQHLSDSCQEIVENWENRSERIRKLRGLRSHLESLSPQAPDSRHLKKLSLLLKNPDLNRQEFASVQIPLMRTLERLCSRAIVRHRDHEQPQSQPMPLHLVLDCLRSAHNVGSILRSFDAVGGDRLYLTGYTPGIENTQVQKVSMGACHSVQVEHVIDTRMLLGRMKNEGITVYALETCDRAKDLFTTELHFPCAFVVGNERFGIPISTLDQCQQVLHLPMYGFKNSLNVANSVSVAAYHARNLYERRPT